MNSKLIQKIKSKTIRILIESYDTECNMESQFLSYYSDEFSNMWNTIYDNVREPVADVIDDIDLYHIMFKHNHNILYYILPIPANIKSSVLKSLY
jgi:hypothetical protein